MVRFSRRQFALMLGTSPLVLRAAAAAATYDALVASFDPNVVSYWKFENGGADQTDGHNARIIGTPEFGVDTIVDLDTTAEGAPNDGECIAWPGTGGVYAEVAHDEAHKTAAGMIVVTFQCDRLAEKSTLVAADANRTAGGLGVEVRQDGAPRCFLQRAVGGVAQLVGKPGYVQLNQAYTLIFKWGPGGLSMTLWNAGGNVVGRSTDPLEDGVTGTSPIRFGAWHHIGGNDIDHHEGPYGRVIWLNRRLSDLEEASLARPRTIARTAPVPDDTTTPEAHGWGKTGNNMADNVGAFNRAIAAASAMAINSRIGRGVIELVPGKVYVMNCPNGKRNDSNGCAILNASTPNVEIRTKGKPAGSTRAVLKFADWSGQSRMHNRALVLFDGASNCWLTHVRLDGNKWSVGNTQPQAENTLLNEVNYEMGNNSGLNNIAVQGSTGCRIEHVESYDALVDGLWIDSIDSALPISDPLRTENLLVQDCDFHHNRRQGLSIITAGRSSSTWDQIVFRRVKFRHTGEDSTGGFLLRGQKPGFGVDIEPNNPNELLFGIAFDDCEFDDNHGSTIQGTPGGASIQNISAGRGYCLDMKNFTARHLKIINCRFRRNKDDGILWFLRDGGNVDQWEISDCVMPTGANANGINEIRFDQPGLLTNGLMVNNNVPLINFRSTIPGTGHSVTIWKGSFNPAIHIPTAECEASKPEVCQRSITVRDGLPR